MRKGAAMDEEVRVRLTDQELIDRGNVMSAKVEHIGQLRKKRREDLRSINAIIESEQDEVERLARVIRKAEEARNQGELFVDDQVATETLAEVARRACTEIDALTCPVHGTCSCVPDVGRLMCVGAHSGALAHSLEVAACIGTEEGGGPGCNLCCEHDGGLCREVTEADQPKQEKAPAVKAIDCQLHGTDAEHAKARAEAAPTGVDENLGPEDAETPEAEAEDDDEEDETDDEVQGEPV